MTKIVEIQGVESLQRALSREIKQKLGIENKPSVIVGYTQNYAIYVHENMASFHPVGQAKYLEQPARELRNVIIQIVRQAVQNGATLSKALVLAGLRLQRESQKLVPVDTGALKGSAFTRLETD